METHKPGSALKDVYKPSLEPSPLSENREGVGNMAIQCLVPKEFNQSSNHMLMFTYAVKIGGVRSCMGCMIESFSKY